MREVLLSICIPTYNFGSFIGETLNSIIPQLTDYVEIVIVDGASTDNTEHVVQSFQEKTPNIRYIKLEKRGGIDQDMALAVDAASGKYCWLFSADDIMEKNAISFILGKMNTSHDVYLCETILCTLHLEQTRRYRNLNVHSEKTFNLSNMQERHEYFRLACNTQAFFSFCGALIIKKSRWIQSPSDERFMGSCWAHAARIFAMLPKGLVVQHLPVPLSLKRGDNDSFLDKGWVHRIKIGIEGYTNIGEYFFGRNSIEYFHIQRCLQYEYPLRTMLITKYKCLAEKGEKRADIALLNELFHKAYASPAPVNFRFLLYHYAPTFVLGLLLRLNGVLKQLLTRYRICSMKWRNARQGFRLRG